MKLLEQQNNLMTLEITRGEAAHIRRILVNVRHNVYQIQTRRNIAVDQELVVFLITRLKNLFEPIRREE